MYIAPGIKSEKWNKLNLDHEDSVDWVTAIDILKQRIESRYIEPADKLIESDNILPASKRRYGFTILAIDCLLIETLQSFIDGRNDSKNKSKKLFKKFLTSRHLFAKHFTDDLAERFYLEFRCGILHQAEIQGNAKVWSIGPMLKLDGNHMTINRTKLHENLKKEFELYLSDLNDKNNIALRKNFRTKMGYICSA